MKRQLAVIFYADVAGYSRMTGLDEEGTHAKLNAGLDLMLAKIAEYDGKKVHEAGDAVLAEFLSVTEAVESAVAFQKEMASQDAGPGNEQLKFRIGVNIGEVIHDRGDVYGDGVNLAARVQELAEPGGVCITSAVHEQLLGKSEHGFDDLGFKKLKNIDHLVRIYALRNRTAASTTERAVFFDHLEDTRPVTSGGCLCGEIRFEIRGKDIGSSYCHCRMCQRFAGAPVSAGTGFLYNDFELTKGEPAIYRSSVIAERAFCRNCGSSLWMKFVSWQWIFIKTANLDNPEDFAPTTHFGVESQMPWHEVHDEFPRIKSEDSPELNQLWENAGVRATDPPRNTRVSKKPRSNTS